MRICFYYKQYHQRLTISISKSISIIIAFCHQKIERLLVPAWGKNHSKIYPISLMVRRRKGFMIFEFVIYLKVNLLYKKNTVVSITFFAFYVNNVPMESVLFCKFINYLTFRYKADIKSFISTQFTYDIWVSFYDCFRVGI